MSAIQASSGHWTDILDAVEQTNPGDSVHLPEGDLNFIDVGETWKPYDITGAGMVEIPPDVSVFGAPTERTSGFIEPGQGMSPNNQVVEYKTKLRIPWGVTFDDYKGVFFKFLGSERPDTFNRLSDIEFIGFYDPADDEFQRQKYRLVAAVFQYVGEMRVDHCRMEHMRGGGVVTRGTTTHGVVDHCELVNPVWKHWGPTMAEQDVGYGITAIRVYFNKQGLSGDALLQYWDFNIENIMGKYTDYTLFMEDNKLTGWRHDTAANWGAHYVFRNNTIEDDIGFGTLDWHGWGFTDTRDGQGIVQWLGTRAVEIYRNKIINAKQYVSAAMSRGGESVHFDNIVGGGTYRYYLQIGNEGDWVPGHNYAYAWDNTMLPGCSLANNPSLVTEGRPPYPYDPFPYPHSRVSGKPLHRVSINSNIPGIRGKLKSRSM